MRAFGFLAAFLMFDNRIDHAFRAQRKSAIDENALQTVLTEVGFKHQQRAQLAVPILLDDEVYIVRIEKRFDGHIEREPAEAHEIGSDSARSENVKRFPN